MYRRVPERNVRAPAPYLPPFASVYGRAPRRDVGAGARAEGTRRDDDDGDLVAFSLRITVPLAADHETRRDATHYRGAAAKLTFVDRASRRSKTLPSM